MRIAKALKAGEDPNETNPTPKEENIETEFGQIDPDAQDIDEAAAEQATRPRQPSVEEIPDEQDRVQRKLAGQSSINESLHPSRSSSIPRPTSAQPTAPPAPPTFEPSPLQNMDVDTEQDTGLNLPSAPETIAPPPRPSGMPSLPDTPGSTDLGAPRSSHPPAGFQSFPPPSTIPSSPPATSHDPSSFYNPPAAPTEPSGAPFVVPNPYQTPQVPPVQPAPVPASAQAIPQTADDQAIALAQKHARWAVSALTFDDVNTAIKELKNSLRHLGAE